MLRRLDFCQLPECGVHGGGFGRLLVIIIECGANVEALAAERVDYTRHRWLGGCSRLGTHSA